MPPSLKLWAVGPSAAQPRDGVGHPPWLAASSPSKASPRWLCCAAPAEVGEVTYGANIAWSSKAAMCKYDIKAGCSLASSLLRG